MMNNKISIFFGILLIIIGCKKDNNTSMDGMEMEVEPEEEITIAKDLNGTVLMSSATYSNYLIESELDESTLDENGKFEISTHGVLVLKNKMNNKPVYFGIPQSDEKDYTLDSKETALYFALLAIPHIRRPQYRVNINNFKKALYEVPEVKILEASIKECVEEYGYLDYEKINKALGEVGNKITTELDISKTSFNGRSVNWNSKYSAGNGFFRVDDKIPDNWEDKYDEATKTYRLKRRFYNQSGAVIGIRVEKFNSSINGVQPPFSGQIIGFVEPYFPPNLLSVDGSLDNLKAFVEHNTDILTNGWDGFVNTDAYSSFTELEFDAKKREKDAIVFSNGFYESDIFLGVNILYLVMDNFSNIFTSFKKSDNLSSYTGEEFLKGFIAWMAENNIEALQNYTVWFANLEYDLLIQDLKDKVKNYIAITSFSDAQESYLAQEIFSKADKYLENTVGSIGAFYKYSRIAAKVVGAYITTQSPKFNAAIPIEFDELSYPPQAFRPDPINIQLENLTNYNFNWQADGSYTSDIYFGVYLGKSVGNLELLGTTALNNFQYNVQELEPNTRYYWQVESFYQNGLSSKSAIWTFDNGVNCRNPNQMTIEKLETQRFIISDGSSPSLVFLQFNVTNKSQFIDRLERSAGGSLTLTTDGYTSHAYSNGRLIYGEGCVPCGLTFDEPNLHKVAFVMELKEGNCPPSSLYFQVDDPCGQIITSNTIQLSCDNDGDGIPIWEDENDFQ